jgi:hypothetical protein
LLFLLVADAVALGELVLAEDEFVVLDVLVAVELAEDEFEVEDDLLGVSDVLVC